MAEAVRKKGVIPCSMRDLLIPIQSGDAGSESGMTVLRCNFLLYAFFGLHLVITDKFKNRTQV